MSDESSGPISFLESEIARAVNEERERIVMWIQSEAEGMLRMVDALRCSSPPERIERLLSKIDAAERIADAIEAKAHLRLRLVYALE